MKKREKGFIATSLLYSFFLVFLALIMVLINSYIANKTIIDRFNEEVEKELNNNTYKIKLRVKNGIAIGGVSLENKIINGDFSNGIEEWVSSGASYNLSGNSLSKYGSSGSYFYQSVPGFIEGHKYFYGVTYNQNHDYQLYSYIDGQSMSNGIITKRAGSYIKAGTVYERSNINGAKNVYLGYGNNPSTTNATNFKNIILIDLTSSYGANNEPNVKWLIENIDYFDASVSYLVKEWQENTDALEIETQAFSSSNTVNIKTINCRDVSNNAISVPFNIFERKTAIENGRTVYNTKGKLTFSNLKSDVSCYVEWEV